MSATSESINHYIEESSKLLKDWKETNDEIALKTKMIKENECALAVLEKNIGVKNELYDLRDFVNELKLSIDKDVKAFKEKDANINAVKKECAKMIETLLKFYDKCSKELFYEAKEFGINDAEEPIAAQAAKVFWSDIDNHQLRADPPISGVYKNAYYNQFDFKENATASNASLF